MATYTNALLNIEEIVSRFLFKFKLPLEDAVIYIEHACNAVRDFNLYDGNLVTYKKYTLDITKKWLEMPDDMLGFVDLVTPLRGSFWSFSEKSKIVTTTTTTGGVEGQDSDQSEGVQIDQPRITAYGARGAWNKFNYNIDWTTRRIYIDDEITEDIVLFYVSSGVKTASSTEVPDFLTPVIDSYLLWKSSYWRMELARERQMLERDYQNERMKLRGFVNSMSYEQWRDIFYFSFTQSPQR
jgi:hypothetical protein